jgi:hypothetical protein
MEGCAVPTPLMKWESSQPDSTSAKETKTTLNYKGWNWLALYYPRSKIVKGSQTGTVPKKERRSSIAAPFQLQILSA